MLKKSILFLTVFASISTYPMLTRTVNNNNFNFCNPQSNSLHSKLFTYCTTPSLPDTPIGGSPCLHDTSAATQAALTPAPSSNSVDQQQQNLCGGGAAIASQSTTDLIQHDETNLVVTIEVDGSVFEEITSTAQFTDPNNPAAVDNDLIRAQHELRTAAHQLTQNVIQTVRDAGKIKNDFSSGENQSWWSSIANKCSAGVQAIRFITTSKHCAQSAHEVIISSTQLVPLIAQKLRLEFRGDNSTEN